MNRRTYLSIGLGAATLTAGCSELGLGGDEYETAASLTVENEDDIKEQPVRSLSVELEEGDKIKLEYQHPNDVPVVDGWSIVTVFNAETGSVVLSNTRKTSESLQPDDLGVPNHLDTISGSVSIGDQPDWVHRYQVPEAGKYQLVWGYHHETRFNRPAVVSLARASGNSPTTDPPDVDELVTGFRRLIRSGWAIDNWSRKNLQQAYKGIDGLIGSRGPLGLLDIYWREVVRSLANSNVQIQRKLEQTVTLSRLSYLLETTQDHLDLETDKIIELTASALVSQLNVSTDDAERIPTILATEMRNNVSLTVGEPYSRSGKDLTATAWVTGTVDLSEIGSLGTYNIEIPIELNARFKTIKPYHIRPPKDDGYFGLSQHEQEPTIN